MCVYMYVYEYVCMLMYMYVNIYIYIHACICIYILRYTHMYTHRCIYIYIHVYCTTIYHIVNNIYTDILYILYTIIYIYTYGNGEHVSHPHAGWTWWTPQLHEASLLSAVGSPRSVPRFLGADLGDLA